MRQAFAGDTAAGVDCPPSIRIWEAVNGQLEPADAAAVVDHVSSCGACAEAWRIAREVEVEEAGGGSVIPFPARRRTSFVWGLLAAAATLILAIGAWPLLRGTPAPATPAATAVTPAPAAAPAAAPAQTTAALGPAIEKAPVVLSASRVLVFRNQTRRTVRRRVRRRDGRTEGRLSRGDRRLGAPARNYPAPTSRRSISACRC